MNFSGKKVLFYFGPKSKQIQVTLGAGEMSKQILSPPNMWELLSGHTVGIPTGSRESIQIVEQNREREKERMKQRDRTNLQQRPKPELIIISIGQY